MLDKDGLLSSLRMLSVLFVLVFVTNSKASHHAATKLGQSSSDCIIIVCPVTLGLIVIITFLNLLGLSK